MNFISRYLAYLKNNPEQYWFKRKVYGWGWTPATWQGWLTLAIFLVLMVLNASRASDELRASFFLETAGLLALLIAICYLTGESPRWQWGLPDDKTNL
jgi:hypothetical protein